MKTVRNVEIRRLQETDANALLQYFGLLVALDQERVERPEDAQKLDLASEVNWIKKRLHGETEQELFTLCIESNGAIVAVGEIERGKRWIERHVAELRFGVLPDFHGVASELVEELLAWGKSIGIEIVTYFHLESQSNGLRTMTEAGFKECGRIPKYYKRGTRYVDRIYLCKSLVG